MVAATSVARPDPPRRADHVWPVDVVRLSAFAAVIMVHSIAFTEQPDNSLAAGALMLLQFGREVFFALTAFVLVLSTQWGLDLGPAAVELERRVRQKP